MLTCVAGSSGFISRRQLLATAAVGAVAAGPLSGITSAALRRRRPQPVTRDLLWSWNEMIAGGGPRLTGNAAHRAYVEFLARQLERRGLEVKRDHLSLTKWEPKDWSLTVGGTEVPLSFYFPYSGVTRPSGVTAPLAYLGVSPVTAWEAAAGKIAVVEVPSATLPSAAFFPEQGRYPETAKSPPTLLTSPGVNDIIVGPDLAAAKKAGVRGVICVRQMISDDYAADQYSPFTTPYQDCPAVWARPSTANRLRTLALQGATATLTMHARLVPGTPTDTLYAVLPGSDPSGEAIVVNTHTDGPNVPEENGSLGILAIADHFRRIPRSRRRRSLIFLFATGHFQLPQFATDLGQAASRWIEMHPDLVERTVAALTLEHLGCLEWLDNDAHTSYGPTGRLEPGYCFTTTETMTRTWLDSARGTSNKRTFACSPTIYVGEGQPFYESGIATMSLIPGMTYLVAAPENGAIDRLSPKLMNGQIKTFINAIDALEKLDASVIGKP